MDDGLSNIEQKTRAEMVRLLYAQSSGMIIGSLMTATCILFALYHVQPRRLFLVWYAFIVFLTGLRFVSAKFYQLAHPAPQQAGFWKGLFLTITLFGSITWALLGTLLLPSDPLNQLLIVFAIAGITSGSVLLFASGRFICMTFLMIVLLPFGINMLLQQTIVQGMVGFLSFVYLIVLLIMSNQVYQKIYKTIMLKYEKDTLFDNLATAKNKVDMINQQLYTEISNKEKIAALLMSNEEQYRLVTDALPVLIAYIDKNLNFRYVNKAYSDWYQRPMEEIKGQSMHEVMGEEWYRVFIEHYQNRNQLQPKIYETTMYTSDEQERYVSVTLIPHIRDNQELGIFSLISDMTPRMNYLATHDTLTNLPNRGLFNARLLNAIKHVDGTGGKLALLFLDLDHFKNINDTLGHDIGDQLLVRTVDRIKSCIHKNDMLARLGGDEFTIILEEAITIDHIKIVAAQICDEIAKVFRINDHDLYITVSTGISIYPDDADTAQKLLKNADLAMYRAKERGRNTFEFFTNRMNEVIQRKIMIENSLRTVLDRSELKIYYQPFIDFKTNKICGLEALLRWYHPKMGFVSPAEFIPIAVERGMIVSIGEWVMREACKQVKYWQKLGYPELYLSVNLSAKQFLQNDFVEMIARILNETGLDGKYLVLELTESLIMGDVEYSIKMVKALKGLDITISLDDFGTGYASLSYLKRVPFDIIKIDRTFMTDFSLNHDDAAIVKAVISLGHNLYMKVIAEGVERPEQFVFLHDHGCDQFQGYLFYPPLPEVDVLPALESTVGEVSLA